jgi:hypothetical protein
MPSAQPIEKQEESPFVAHVRNEGSLRVTQPLLEFLDRCVGVSDLRRQVRDTVPALLADIAHFMAISHGRHPGVVDHAADKMADQSARQWVKEATLGFAGERDLLNRMIVAAGPIRRHADQDKITALLGAQARSFELLATSERTGCAAGAAIAFVLDWQFTRPLLERTAVALGVEPRVCALPSAVACQQLVQDLGVSPAVERAICFGSDQILAQQSGLWKLVAARHLVISQLY